MTGLPVVPQIQVCLDCNLDCAYCFEKHSGRQADLETVSAILHGTVEHNRHLKSQAPVQVYWHGGEPLLAGLKFFRSVVALESTFDGVGFNNRIQTNATLMTDDLARFLGDHGFMVGFSLDGPEDLHDRHRRFRQSGKGSFAAAMKGVERYLRHNPQNRPAVIAVVTRHSIDRVDDIYRFFDDLGATVQLDIYDLRLQDLLKEQANENRGRELRPTPEQIGRFLIRLFDLWFNNPDGRADFAELRHEVKMALRPQLEFGPPIDKKRCDFRRLIFDPQGNAFSCDQYINDSATTLGNIHMDAMEDMVRRKSQLWEAIKARFRRTDEGFACDTCQWGRQCAGGCLTCMKYNYALKTARSRGWPDKRWPEVTLPDSIRALRGETYYCEGLKAFRTHVKRSVDAALDAA